MELFPKKWKGIPKVIFINKSISKIFLQPTLLLSVRSKPFPVLKIAPEVEAKYDDFEIVFIKITSQMYNFQPKNELSVRFKPFPVFRIAPEVQFKVGNDQFLNSFIIVRIRVVWHA